MSSPVESSADLPANVVVRPPGPQSLAWRRRMAQVSAPMGPAPPVAEHATGIVYQHASGSHVFDVDGNRYVDLCAGFGALPLGHCPTEVLEALKLQSQQLLQALGDVHPSSAKIELLERLTTLVPGPRRQAILSQSGADAVTAALKTARLATGKPGVVAFEGAYHGLSFAPLAACGLRSSYRQPFADQLSQHVHWLAYPKQEPQAQAVLLQLEEHLATGTVGAVLLEPILGRGGVTIPPAGFLAGVQRQARRAAALLILDEIWTGLGRSGHWLYGASQGVDADLICLGKGLGGGLPISACVGDEVVMRSWARAEEVVDTSTFAGAPLVCRCALATLQALESQKLVERSRSLGADWLAVLKQRVQKLPQVRAVRGSGLMLAIDLGHQPGRAHELQAELLRRGYLVSTGGGQREVLILTPALTISEQLLEPFAGVLAQALQPLPAA